MEAISFGFFNKPYRDIKLLDLINNKNKKGLYVHIEFERDGVDYTITRGMKPDILRVSKNGEELNLESHKSLIQEQIDTILGINHSLFRNIISLSSLYNKPFLTLPLGDRRTLLENIFGIKVFGDILKKVKKRLSLVKGDLTLKSQSEEVKKSNLATLVDQRNKVELAKKNFDQEKAKKLNDLDLLLLNLRKEEIIIPEAMVLPNGIEGNTVELEKLVSEVSLSLNNAQNKIESKFPQFSQFTTKSLDSIRVKIQENEKRISLSQFNIKEHELELRGVRFKLDELGKKKVQKENLVSSVISKKKERIVEVKSEASQLNGFLKQLEGAGATCSMCGQSITEEHKGAEKDRVETKKKGLKAEYDFLNSEITKELDELYEIEVKRFDKDKLVHELDKKGLEEKINSEESVVKSVKEENVKLESEYTLLDLEIRGKKDLLWETICKDLRDRLQFYKEELFTKVSQIKKRDLVDQEIRLQRSKKESLELRIRELEKTRVEQEALEFHFDLGDLGQKISKLTSEIGILDNEIRLIRGKSDELEILKGCLEDDGVRKYFFNKVLKTFNQLVSGYVERFGMGIRVMFDDSFEVVIKEGPRERVYESFSAGEQCRINLSITLSFMELNAALNSFDCNIQVFDEIFDVGMDDEGMEAVLEKMKELTDAKRKSCYIISHKAVDNSPFVDNIIQVKRVNGFSKMVVG